MLDAGARMLPQSGTAKDRHRRTRAQGCTRGALRRRIAMLDAGARMCPPGQAARLAPGCRREQRCLVDPTVSDHPVVCGSRDAPAGSLGRTTTCDGCGKARTLTAASTMHRPSGPGKKTPHLYRSSDGAAGSYGNDPAAPIGASFLRGAGGCYFGFRIADWDAKASSPIHRRLYAPGSLDRPDWRECAASLSTILSRR